MPQKGLLSTVGEWFNHPFYSEGSIKEWLAALALILVLSFLWSTVVREIE